MPRREVAPTSGDTASKRSTRPGPPSCTVSASSVVLMLPASQEATVIPRRREHGRTPTGPRGATTLGPSGARIKCERVASPLPGLTAAARRPETVIVLEEIGSKIARKTKVPLVRLMAPVQEAVGVPLAITPECGAAIAPETPGPADRPTTPSFGEDLTGLPMSVGRSVARRGPPKTSDGPLCLIALPAPMAVNDAPSTGKRPVAARLVPPYRVNAPKWEERL